ncbi:zinc finger protein 782-like isoform X3 [Branchiostoma lanceolatum]|uniref:zinc finger protein 782-like isoform X3 n=1 Tax=Branchiostoma lanceolatum TaxID=7740 RepID=UPI003455148D
MSSNLAEEASFRERPGGQAVTQMEEAAEDLHEQTEEKRPCPDTDYGGTRKQRRKTHSGERPHRCRECEFSTSKMSALKRHVRTSHAAGKRKQTKKDRLGKDHLVNDVGATNGGERPFQCAVCDYSAAQKSTLKYHIMAKHSNYRPYKCPQCNHYAVTKEHLKVHMRSHTGEKPYRCETCAYSTAQKSSLKSHMATHTWEKPHQCGICGYSAAQMSHLKQHMATHTGEKPYKCGVCDYSAIRKSALKYHTATHTGEKLGIQV